MFYAILYVLKQLKLKVVNESVTILKKKKLFLNKSRSEWSKKGLVLKLEYTCGATSIDLNLCCVCLCVHAHFISNIYAYCCLTDHTILMKLYKK